MCLIFPSVIDQLEMKIFYSPVCMLSCQILVHGEQNEMARLKAALIREYEDNDQVHIEVHNPRNTEAVTLNFRGEKLAKVNKLPFFSPL